MASKGFTFAGGSGVRRAGGTTGGTAPLPFFNVKDYGALGDGTTDDSAAIQAAIQAALLGGTVFVPASGQPYIIGTPLTLPSRVRLVGASSGGTAAAMLQAANGLNNSVIKVGATDGSDTYWHWGEIANLFIRGNKANQATPPSMTITAASNTSGTYTVTVTTATPHGYSIGEIVRISGITPDGYNGDYPVQTVPTSTTFTITVIVASLTAATVFGSVRRLVEGIAVNHFGEASSIHHVYIDNCFDDGIYQGPEGTPSHYSSVSSFFNGGAGFNLWATRPTQLDTPSGDNNGGGLIRCAGKSSAGATGTLGAVLINNIKAEKHTVPVILLDDYDGSVVVDGGGIDMDATNLAAPLRRTAPSSTSNLTVTGLRVLPRFANAKIFEDLSTAAQTRQAVSAGSSTWSFTVGSSPANQNVIVNVALQEQAPTDAASITPNCALGSVFRITGTRATRTMAAPANPPAAGPFYSEITIVLNNTSGAATTTTWGATYVLAAGGWTDPPTGSRASITFYYSGDGKWRQKGSSVITT